MPIILYRNGISNANFGTICDNDINTPDPKPCITRDIISIVKLVLKPHIKLPILNKSNPAIAHK